jgi:putative ABC transport system permease protein
MFGYYLRLALKSCARDVSLTTVVVVTMGLGLGVCLAMLTLYRAMASNPIWWKNDRLYAVTMDSWSPDRPENPERPGLPPPQLTYLDAIHLFQSSIATRKVIMYPVTGVITREHGEPPVKISTRVTSADFFPAFDVPFQYGSGWRPEADTAPAPFIVLSHSLNEALFGGSNSVGRTMLWNGREFRVMGVLRPWMPQQRFYDLTSGSFEEPEAAYVPWGWGEALQLRNVRDTHCWKAEPVDTFRELVGSECTWVQLWVELDSAAATAALQSLLDRYWLQERGAGRFQRPRNNRLTRVNQWLQDNQVVENDTRLLLGLSFVFLGVCLLNTVGLLLAKFLNGARVVSIHRALGASRAGIMIQHLMVVAVLAVCGCLLGFAADLTLLRVVRVLYGGDSQEGAGGIQALAHFDPSGIAWALCLTAVSLAVAGAYPAWTVGRLVPARHLKGS